jgi:hypothetical protein
LKQLETLHNRGLIGLPESVKVSELFDRYEREYAPKLRESSRERMMHVVAQARAWFCHEPLNDPPIQHVTPQHIQRFLDAKRSEGVTARTVNLYRSNLRRVFQIALRRGGPQNSDNVLRWIRA